MIPDPPVSSREGREPGAGNRGEVRETVEGQRGKRRVVERGEGGNVDFRKGRKQKG